MNSLVKTRLRSIFAKEIGKQPSELTTADQKLFEDWISYGLATAHIPAIVEELATSNQNDNNANKSYDIRKTYDLADMKCRNCDLLSIEVREVLAFGYKPTLRVFPTCRYWLHKNRTGYRNAWYSPTLDTSSCTQFIKYRNQLDVLEIPMDDVDEFIINNKEELAILPVRALLDKGFNLVRTDVGFSLVKR